MKNLILLSVLIVLGIFSYYYEELGTIRRQERDEKKDRLFDPSQLGELKSIKLLETELVGFKGKFYTTKIHHLVDLRKLNHVFDIFSKIKIKRYLGQQELQKSSRKLFFPEETLRFYFNFEGGSVSYLLGSKLKFDQSFYMEITYNNEKKWVVAYDLSPIEGIYGQEDYLRSAENYNRFKTLLFLKEDFFYDTRLFREELDSAGPKEWEILDLANVLDEAYQIDFPNLTTDPHPLSALGYNLQSFENFPQELLALEAKKLHFSYSADELKKLLAVVTIKKRSGKKVILELYGRYKGQNGSFIKTSYEKILYEINQLARELFFTKVYYFWNRSALPNDFLAQKNDLNFNIKFPKIKEEIKLRLPVSDRFVVTQDQTNSNDNIGKPDNQAFKELFSFFQRQADRVQLLPEKDKKWLQDVLLSLQFDNIKLHVIFKDGELILVDTIRKLKLSYLIDQKPPIGLSLEDYFL